MSALIAALPMYDWPERHREVDAEWAALRDEMRARGLDAPEELTRHTGDLLEFWHRTDLLFAQTCWGPLELGLQSHVQVVGQPSYAGIEGGKGGLYSSAIVRRRVNVDVDVAAPSGEEAALPPLDSLRGLVFAYNVPDSMSGLIGLERDLEAAGAGSGIFAARLETGGHRASMRAVAAGAADVAAIDCMSWALARRFEPAALELSVVGWTAKRKGLPYITAGNTASDVLAKLRAALLAIQPNAS